MSAFSEAVAAWVRGERSLSPVSDLLGVRPLSAGGGAARAEMEAKREHLNAMGTVHGGILAALADVVMGVALATQAEEGETFANVDLQMHYLRPAREGGLTASARVLRRGRTTGFAECDLHSGGELVARAQAAVVFTRPR